MNEMLHRESEVKGDSWERARCAQGTEPSNPVPFGVQGVREVCLCVGLKLREESGKVLGGCAGPGVGLVDLTLVLALEGWNERAGQFPHETCRTK